jgi:hypothetical protein
VRLSLALILSLAPVASAQDGTFTKTRYASVKHPNEAVVGLSITDSGISIQSQKVSKKATEIHLEIPYSSIETLSYELSAHHRLKEGAAVTGLR